jgi:hypothetical protein
MTRRVEGLRWARRLEERPSCIPVGRPRGQKADGVRFERMLAQAFHPSSHGVWWEYSDRNGRGYCQTDFVFRSGETLVILECKLTWKPEAEFQLTRLYKPVVSEAMKTDRVSILSVVVCKNLIRGLDRRVCGSLEESLEVRDAGIPVWHVLGVPQLRAFKPGPPRLAPHAVIG